MLAARSKGADDARFNALLAVEVDPVRLHERVLDLRLSAAVALAPRVERAEALLLGVPVPASRLDERLSRRLGLNGDVVLDEVLAWRVLGVGGRETLDGV